MLRVVSSEAPANSSVNVLSLDPLAGASSVDAAAAAMGPLARSSARLGAFGPAAASGNALFSARLLRRSGGEEGRVLPSSAVRLEPRPRGALANLRAVALPKSSVAAAGGGGGGDGGGGSGGGSGGGGGAAALAASTPTASAPLLAGTVRLSVLAAGLNFRDVLNVLDMYPAGAGDPGPPGADVLGVVEEVGPPPAGDGDAAGAAAAGAEDPLRPGDLVLGLAPGCLGPGALAPASLLVRFPRELLAGAPGRSGGGSSGGMTAAEAATLPTAFATAILAFDAAAAADAASSSSSSSSSSSPSSSLFLPPCALPAGSRALIHAGAGGVGMAALRLASAAGVPCLATAGSPGRRRLARGAGAAAAAASRDVSFVDSAVLWPSSSSSFSSSSSSSSLSTRLPRMALSSLTSPGFVAATLACLAGSREGGEEGGGGGGGPSSSTPPSMVEISKRGVWSPQRVAQERPDVRYGILAIDLLPEERLRAALRRVLRFAAEGESVSSSSSPAAAASPSSPSSFSSAALPATVLPMRDARRALRELGAAKHAGKVVLEVRPAAATAAARRAAAAAAEEGEEAAPLPPALAAAAPRPPARFPAWVVTGGLGALGGLTARWLCASQGAQKVVLASRDAHGLGEQQGGEGRGAASAAARGELGAEVSVARCDAASAADVAALLEPLLRRRGSGGIAGLIHSGGALADAPAALARPAGLRAAAAAKAPAARAFAARLAAEPLLSTTGTVAFASTAALLGAPGQAAYAAANGAMESVCGGAGGGCSLSGERALSLQWGGWSLGMAASGGNGGSGGSSASSSSSSPSAAAAIAARMKRNGMTPLDAELGLSALAAAMRGPLLVGDEEGGKTSSSWSASSSSSSTLAAAVVDWPLLLKGKGPPPPFFSDLVPPQAPEEEKALPSLQQQPAVEQPAKEKRRKKKERSEERKERAAAAVAVAAAAPPPPSAAPPPPSAAPAVLPPAQEKKARILHDADPPRGAPHRQGGARSRRGRGLPLRRRPRGDAALRGRARLARRRRAPQRRRRLLRPARAIADGGLRRSDVRGARRARARDAAGREEGVGGRGRGGGGGGGGGRCRRWRCRRRGDDGSASGGSPSARGGSRFARSFFFL